MKILLVDDEPEILDILQEFLEHSGHQVSTASNGREALDIVLADDGFDLVFSDLKMPVMDGLTFLEKIRHHDISLPVVLISGQGDLESSIRALKLGALDFIVKPVHLKSVAEALDKIETAIATEQESINALQLVQEQNISLVCDSQLKHIRNIISYFNRQTQDLCANYSLDGNKIAICLQECLTNAIIHGNFQIDSSLKETDWSSFDRLIKDRESEENYVKKKVSIKFQQLTDKILFNVSDDGVGFDPEQLPDPTNPESWLKLSGRGILFIRSYMDEVTWNESGNSIIMTKLLK